jgi:hypothetical protein
LKNSLTIFFLTTFLVSTGQQNNVDGYYSSNFAVSGWFGTQILLNTDKTFIYQYTGDLFNDKATGSYKVVNDTIFLEFTPELIDTITYVITDSTGKEVKFKPPQPVNHAAGARPQKLLHRRDKLLIVKSDGQILKKARDGKGKKREYYLLRQNGHSWTYW